MSRPPALVVALVIGALGCGGSEGSEGQPGDAAEPSPSVVGCQAIAGQCRTAQQGCIGAVDGVDAHCSLCPSGHGPQGELAQCAQLAGEARVLQFHDITLQPGEELDGVCQSVILNNETELWVNAVEFESEGAYHHSNWFFVPEGKVDYPPGLWMDCYNSGFHEVEAALKGGVLYAQSTQVSRELQAFPAGAAVRIPPYSRVIGATHVLNFLAEERTTSSVLRLYTIDPADVAVKLTPFRLNYGALEIPAQSKSDFSGTCDIDERFQTLLGEPLDLQLYYALPHFHVLGSSFRLEISGGERDGELIFEQDGYGADPFGRVFDPPIDLTGAKGVRFTCGYTNPRDTSVGYGIGDQEMCVMLGFAASPLAFDAGVNENTAVNPLAGGDVSSEGATVHNEGPCLVQAFPFDQQKDGGLAPE